MLGGCASLPGSSTGSTATTMTVTLRFVDDVRAACGWSALEPHGCAKVRGNTCEIIAKRPRGFDDRARLQTLGHELLHCLEGPVHR